MLNPTSFIQTWRCALAIVPVLLSPGLSVHGDSLDLPTKDPPGVIIVSAEASPLERLAGRELRRYLYLATGRLLPVLKADVIPEKPLHRILLARKNTALVRSALGGDTLAAAVDSLGSQQFLLTTRSHGLGELLWVVGGDDIGTLYGAYRLAEHFGVRYYLHGDVVPSQQSEFALPSLDERNQPLFKLRGILPFHDFPEGPDWWNTDDYLAVIAQLPKLRMNFFGLHTYPEGKPNAEPTVWIGLKEHVHADGTVKSSYPASYHSTARTSWGYRPRKTSEFLFGASQLFERDDFSAAIMMGQCPEPEDERGSNEIFNRTGALLREAFGFARELGVKTCIGTEVPLTVPRWVRDRMDSAGWQGSEAERTRALYEGMFTRILRTHPLDYYWFWTPETWLTQGAARQEIIDATGDILSSLRIAPELELPFQFAVSGWTVGPKQAPLLFHRRMPQRVILSALNPNVGLTPVDPRFGEMTGRERWAIPWLEDDPALTIPQLWVGRLRRDAADAFEFGCEGLIGIHWRTFPNAPNVSALAQAAWRQEGWHRQLAEARKCPPGSWSVGGRAREFTGRAIAGTDSPSIFESLRDNPVFYQLALSNGTYRVELWFGEREHLLAGERVFDVKLQGQYGVRGLDIHQRVGRDHALVLSFDGVTVTNGHLRIDFEPLIGNPCLSAIVVDGEGMVRRYNCGGQARLDWLADLETLPNPRDLPAPTVDLYEDWGVSNFGRDAGAKIGRIFARIDGDHTPRPVIWRGGPGGIIPDRRPWFELRKEYDFLDQLGSLTTSVKHVDDQARFETWLSAFRYTRAIAQLSSTWFEYNQAFENAKGKASRAARRQSARTEVLPLRIQLIQRLEEVYTHLLSMIVSPGELGTIANWEQHIIPDLLDQSGAELAGILGHALPAAAIPRREYTGPTRIIVPTTRTILRPGEGLRLKVIILSPQPPREAFFFARQLGEGRYRKLPLTSVAQGVYTVSCFDFTKPDLDFEYYIQVVANDGVIRHFPPSAPQINQTVVFSEYPTVEPSAETAR
ncbi:MAG: hypothetical protein KJ072_08625 [Verrucomicrobia bacterium]|nr:hypothetical protein [Verrucomicrobiota bacterium]